MKNLSALTYVILCTTFCSCDQSPENEDINNQVTHTKKKTEKITKIDFTQLQEQILNDAEEIEEKLKNETFILKIINFALDTKTKSEQIKAGKLDPETKINPLIFGNSSFIIIVDALNNSGPRLIVRFNFDYSEYTKEEQDILNEAQKTFTDQFNRTFADEVKPKSVIIPTQMEA